MAKKHIRTATILFLLALAALTFFSSTISNSGIALVEVVQTAKGGLRWDITAEGRVAAAEYIGIYPPEALKILDIYHKPGDTAEKGMPLIRFDVSSYLEAAEAERRNIVKNQLSVERINLRLEELNSEMLQLQDEGAVLEQREDSITRLNRQYKTRKEDAEAAITRAEAELDIIRALFEAGAETQMALSAAEAAADEARLVYARLLADYESEYDAILKEAENTIKDNENLLIQKERAIREAELELKALSLSDMESAARIKAHEDKAARYAYIYAPDNVVIESTAFEAGMYAQPGVAVMKTAVHDSGLRIEFYVTGEQLKYIFIGGKAQIKSEVSAETKMEALITRIDYADRADGTWKVIAEGNLDGFSLGGKVTVEIIATSGPYQYTLPAEAVRQNGSQRYVYVIKTRNTSLGEEYYLQKAVIVIEDTDGDTVAVSSGVTWLDSVVIESSRPVFEGQKVRVIN